MSGFSTHCDIVENSVAILEFLSSTILSFLTQVRKMRITKASKFLTNYSF